jgi:hypothetical protein
MMIVGEILNLVAYAVTSAVLVTPLGALSVVVRASSSPSHNPHADIVPAFSRSAPFYRPYS